MKTMLIVFLAILLASCSRHEALPQSSIDKNVIGQWVWEEDKPDNITFLADGRFFSKWTQNRSNVEWSYEGLWKLEDGILITTLTKSSSIGSTNSEPVGTVSRLKIISIGERELVYRPADGEINTNMIISLKRKR